MEPFHPKSLLLTGGTGFIGSNFVRSVLDRHPETQVVNLDLLTYAGNLDNLEGVMDSDCHVFVKGDILDGQLVKELFVKHAIDSVVNFAAESHVDRSIIGPAVFVETNVQGTLTLLQASLDYEKIKRFVQIGTDKVYGSLRLDSVDKFSEDTPLAPRSPYSASKAGADFLVDAFHHTYGLPTIITRCSNNYGPYQFPEKLIPLMIRNALNDKPLPVYGDGLFVRDWIHVSDHCAGVWTALIKGRPGEVYNIGADSEMPNIEVVRTILNRLVKPHSLIEHVKDRLGHDRRYAIDSSKIREELEWTPTISFQEGIERTIRWYCDNTVWLERIRSGAYRQ